MTVVQLEFEWSNEVPFNELRSWILSKLKKYGEPLRWAITGIDDPVEKDALRLLKVEAVLVVDQLTSFRS